MQKSLKNKILCATLSVLMLFAIVFEGGLTASLFAFAEGVTDFEKSYVLDDLEGRDDFDLANYPLTTKTHIIDVVEYCFAYDEEKRGAYGLYIYVYNGESKPISRLNGSNTVQLATRYDTNHVTKDSKVKDYDSFELKFCSTVEGGVYDHRFYKFKVVDKEGFDGKKIVERVNRDFRRYDISGFELLFEGEIIAKDFTGGKTVYCEGFASGLGRDEEALSTLKYSSETLDTLKLEVKNTFVRTGTSNLGDGHQNQIDSVYFKVPNSVLEKYENLQRIKAEWYEYRTKNILVADNSFKCQGDITVYEYLKPYVGKNYHSVNHSFPSGVKYFRMYSEVQMNISEGLYYYYDHYGDKAVVGGIKSSLSPFMALFPANDITAYDPYTDVVENGGAKGSKLYDYYLTNPLGFTDYYSLKGGNKIAKGYFNSDIPQDRKRNDVYGKMQHGYSVYDFDADAHIQTVTTYNPSDHSWQENVDMYGFWKATFGKLPESEALTVKPIIRVDRTEFNGGLSESRKKELADKFLVNYRDIDDFMLSVFDSGSTTFLFRFALSDYYSKALKFETQKLFSDDYDGKDLAYVAQQEVFLDFDIIQLTFKATDGDMEVLPVVANPIDIVNDITTPVVVDEGEVNWFEKVLGALAIILLLVILLPVLPYVIKFVVWLIKLPYKAVISIKRKKNKDKTSEDNDDENG